MSLHLSHPSTAASSPLMRSSAWTTTSAPGSSQPVSYAERLRLATNQRAAAAEKAAASASTASVRTPGAGNGQSLEESASADRAAPAAGRPSPPAEEPSNATEGPSSHAKLAPSDAPVEPATGSAATADPASASTSTAASTPAAPANASASTSSDSPTEATDPPTSKTNIWELRRRQREQQKNSSPESGGKPAVNGQPAASGAPVSSAPKPEALGEGATEPSGPGRSAPAAPWAAIARRAAQETGVQTTVPLVPPPTARQHVGAESDEAWLARIHLLNGGHSISRLGKPRKPSSEREGDAAQAPQSDEARKETGDATASTPNTSSSERRAPESADTAISSPTDSSGSATKPGAETPGKDAGARPPQFGPPPVYVLQPGVYPPGFPGSAPMLNADGSFAPLRAYNFPPPPPSDAGAGALRHHPGDSSDRGARRGGRGGARGRGAAMHGGSPHGGIAGHYPMPYPPMYMPYAAFPPMMPGGSPGHSPNTPATPASAPAGSVPVPGQEGSSPTPGPKSNGASPGSDTARKDSSRSPSAGPTMPNLSPYPQQGAYWTPYGPVNMYGAPMYLMPAAGGPGSPSSSASIYAAPGMQGMPTYGMPPPTQMQPMPPFPGYASGNVPPDVAPPPTFAPVPFDSPALTQQLLTQLEFYFSDTNLAQDVYLRQRMDKQGFVTLDLLLQFKRLQSILNASASVSPSPETIDSERHESALRNAVAESAHLELNAEKTHVRRRHGWEPYPLPNGAATEQGPKPDEGQGHQR